MSKVSTRPQKVATPVTVAVTAVTAVSRTATAAAPIENEAFTHANLSTAFASLANTLRIASRTDEPQGYSGNSDRLLRLAADLASTASDVVPEIGNDLERTALDIAAMVIASRHASGDTASAERQACIAQAKTILDWLGDCGDSLEESPSSVTRGPLHGFTPRQVETVLNEIATKANTLGEFLRQTRERTLNNEGACALYEAIDMAAMLADMLGLLADTPTGGAVRGDAAAWIIGSNFANEEKAVSA